MSTYYDYREVKVLIAHELMKKDDWKVYGYSPDESDSMTDYYSPAHWSGVAEKNGYILCVGIYGAEKETEIRQYNNDSIKLDKNIFDKITKLENMTVERGASEQEEESAKRSIELLKQKASENENNNNYVVVGHIPAHMAHPPKCNWHIEKDGIIIAKGNGILKYAKIDQYFNYDHYKKDMEEFKTMSKQEYLKSLVDTYMLKGYYADKEQALKSAESHYKTLQDDLKLIDKFNELINKFDTTCGCLVGNGELEQYETIKVTEYKKENKVFETETGSIQDGQCFILKTGFNYNRYKGLVYRIHRSEYNGKEYFHAYKLNGKLTKECTGNSSANNHWSCIDDKFLKWIEKGCISWCEVKEVKTPYEVEKVVKKVIKNENKTVRTKETSEEEIIISNQYTYEIKEDIDTRDNSKIYLVKVVEKLDKEEYLQILKFIKSLGGYYSKFKHAFLFKENPTELLSGNLTTQSEENIQETIQEQQEETKIKFTIEEDTHTKTGQPIWLVKLENQISKQEFSEIKQKFATLKGFYSSFKSAFIFNYNPIEILENVS